MVEKTKPLQSEQKLLVLLIKGENNAPMNLCQCVEIRIVGFDRRQLQKKRQDLLKRGV